MQLQPQTIDSLKLERSSAASPTASECSSTDEQTKLTLSGICVKEKSIAEMIAPRFWSLVTLSALAASAPLIMMGTLAAIVIDYLFSAGASPKVASNGKVAIVTGGKMTKAFVVIKQLKAQGCRVVLCETSKYWMVASRFSRCVDRFVTVPVPEKAPEAHLKAMAALAEEEKADVFVPVTSPLHSAYEARLSSVLPERCFSWSLSSEEVDALDDKVVFCQAADALGLPTPVSHRMCSHADVWAFNDRLREQAQANPTAKFPRYILKNLQYDSMHRLDLFTLPCTPDALEEYISDILIDESNPWVVQTFVVGDEFSTCAVVKDGRLLAFTDNAACLSCFNYLPARNSKLREWVEVFCAARRLSGILCIDFIIDAEGTPYAIECNPRFSSNITSFYDNPAFGAVLVDPDAFSSTVQPLPSAVETYWLFSEVWAAMTKPGLPLSQRAAGVIDSLLHKKDAYFDPTDPMPFLAHFFVHIPTLLLRNLRNGNKWAKIDPCIGKMTEENGD